jgi:hypothetical protein
MKAQPSNLHSHLWSGLPVLRIVRVRDLVIADQSMKKVWLVTALVMAACGGSKHASNTPVANEGGPAGSTTTMAAVDMKMICDEAQAASAASDQNAGRDAFAKAVQAKLKTDEGRNVYKSAGASADQDKYATLKQGAAEVGVKDWSCKAAFEKLYGTQVEPAPKQ